MIRAISIKELNDEPRCEQEVQILFHDGAYPSAPFAPGVDAVALLAAGPALLSFIENEPGCDFPLHKHEAAQIFIMLEGSEEHHCGGETFLMVAGDVCVHPSNVLHGGRTTTGYRAIDVFVPPREDYLDLMAKHGLPIVGPK